MDRRQQTRVTKATRLQKRVTGGTGYSKNADTRYRLRGRQLVHQTHRQQTGQRVTGQTGYMAKVTKTPKIKILPISASQQEHTDQTSANSPFPLRKTRQTWPTPAWRVFAREKILRFQTATGLEIQTYDLRQHISHCSWTRFEHSSLQLVKFSVTLALCSSFSIFAHAREVGIWD